MSRRSAPASVKVRHAPKKRAKANLHFSIRENRSCLWGWIHREFLWVSSVAFPNQGEGQSSLQGHLDPRPANTNLFWEVTFQSLTKKRRRFPWKPRVSKTYPPPHANSNNNNNKSMMATHENSCPMENQGFQKHTPKNSGSLTSLEVSWQSKQNHTPQNIPPKTYPTNQHIIRVPNTYLPKKGGSLTLSGGIMAIKKPTPSPPKKKNGGSLEGLLSDLGSRGFSEDTGATRITRPCSSILSHLPIGSARLLWAPWRLDLLPPFGSSTPGKKKKNNDTNPK